MAMSADNRNDSISTSVVLVCAIVGLFTNLPLDGYLGVVVSLFVLVSAISLMKETIDPLLGEKPDKDLMKEIENLVLGYNGILGVHELIVHSYGPTQSFATVHIEVDSRVDVMISHELADEIERDCLKKLNVHLVCHLDPLDLADPETVTLNQLICGLLKEKYESVTMHDLRIVKGPTFTNVIFDVVIPFDKTLEEEIKKDVENALANLDGKYYAVIEFEKSFAD